MEVKNMKLWKTGKQENEPEQEQLKERVSKLLQFNPVRFIAGLGGRKKSAGGAVAITLLLLCAVLSNNASAATTKIVSVAAKMTPQDKLNATINNIQLFLVGIGILLGGIMLVLAGTKWMTTRGHPEEQSRVKQWLFDIGIGLIIICSSSVMIEVAKGLIVH
jgi:Na+-driven multidrug efflux pump